MFSFCYEVHFIATFSILYDSSIFIFLRQRHNNIDNE